MDITKTSHVEDVLNVYPDLARVFIQEGLPCLVCGESFWGTIEELAGQYGKEASSIIQSLNKHKRKVYEKS